MQVQCNTGQTNILLALPLLSFSHPFSLSLSRTLILVQNNNCRISTAIFHFRWHDCFLYMDLRSSTLQYELIHCNLMYYKHKLIHIFLSRGYDLELRPCQIHPPTPVLTISANIFFYLKAGTWNFIGKLVLVYKHIEHCVSHRTREKKRVFCELTLQCEFVKHKA